MKNISSSKRNRKFLMQRFDKEMHPVLWRMSTRLITILRWMGIRTLKDFKELFENTFLSYKGSGIVTLRELRRFRKKLA